MIFFREDSLRKAINEFLIHYHSERNHQGLENRLIIPMGKTVEKTGTVHKRQKVQPDPPAVFKAK